MSVHLEVTNLENILARTYRSVKARARDLDSVTLRLQRYVWLFRAERRYVVEIVIPLFDQAVEVLKKNKAKGENKQYIDQIAETIEYRRKNFDNYIAGKCSNYIPVEQLRQIG